MFKTRRGLSVSSSLPSEKNCVCVGAVIRCSEYECDGHQRKYRIFLYQSIVVVKFHFFLQLYRDWLKGGPYVA